MFDTYLRKVHPLKITDDIYTSTIYENVYYHSENALFLHLLDQEYLSKIVKRLIKEQPNITQVELVVLDLHSSRYMCENCMRSLQYMSNPNSPMLQLLSGLLRKNINAQVIPEHHPLQLLSRISADLPFPKESDLKATESHIQEMPSVNTSQSSILLIDSTSIQLGVHKAAIESILFLKKLNQHTVMVSGGSNDKQKTTYLNVFNTLLTPLKVEASNRIKKAYLRYKNRKKIGKNRDLEAAPTEIVKIPDLIFDVDNFIPVEPLTQLIQQQIDRKFPQRGLECQFLRIEDVRQFNENTMGDETSTLGVMIEKIKKLKIGETFLLPFNCANQHFTLLALRRLHSGECKAIYVDSFGDYDEMSQSIQKLCTSMSIPYQLCCSPYQKNNDCAVHVEANAEILLNLPDKEFSSASLMTEIHQRGLDREEIATLRRLDFAERVAALPGISEIYGEIIISPNLQERKIVRPVVEPSFSENISNSNLQTSIEALGSAGYFSPRNSHPEFDLPQNINNDNNPIGKK